MTDGSVRVGVAHPASGYRPPVLLLRAALGALLVRSLRPIPTSSWEDQLSAPWSSFCDDEGLR